MYCVPCGKIVLSLEDAWLHSDGQAHIALNVEPDPRRVAPDVQA
jgi:hypothetical protein